MNIVVPSTMFKLQNNLDPFEKQYPSGYDHGVTVVTTERSYRLFTKDYNFKELFLYTMQQMLNLRGPL